MLSKTNTSLSRKDRSVSSSSINHSKDKLLNSPDFKKGSSFNSFNCKKEKKGFFHLNPHKKFYYNTTRLNNINYNYKSKSFCNTEKITPNYNQKKLALSASREELMEKLEKYKKKASLLQVNREKDSKPNRVNERNLYRSKTEAKRVSPRLMSPIRHLKNTLAISNLVSSNEHNLRLLKETYLNNQNYYINNRNNKIIKNPQEILT